VDAGRDPSSVPRHDEHNLRRFLAARRAGDEVAARRWWDELVRDNFDRVRGMVILRSRGQLSAVEQDEALQRALIKLSNNMIHTFNGTSMGEWVNATKTLVFGACVDTQRREKAASSHRAPLEATDDAGEDTGQLDRKVFKALEKQRLEHEADELDAEDDDKARAFLDWAVPQLSPKRRAVIELDRQDVSCEDIQEQLGVSRDVVYASRSRALKDLAKLREEYGT
jgi:DNA-directed RNA polymerase specialized sigma24 family protein